jgi:hypothetical protein
VDDRSDAPPHYELNAEPGSYSITGAPVGFSVAMTVVYAVGIADGWHLAAGRRRPHLVTPWGRAGSETALGALANPLANRN